MATNFKLLVSNRPLGAEGAAASPGFLKMKVARAWRETTPVCSRLTRLVRAGYSRHDSGASRERARITQRAQDGSVHMQRSLPSSSYPARSTLTPQNYCEVYWSDSAPPLTPLGSEDLFFFFFFGGGGGVCLSVCLCTPPPPPPPSRKIVPRGLLPEWGFMTGMESLQCKRLFKMSSCWNKHQHVLFQSSLCLCS